MSSSALNLGILQAKIGSIQNQADSTSVYSAGVWSFKNSSAVASVTITDAGNVGIGTTNPAQKLAVVGTTRIARPADTTQYLELYSSGGEGFIDAVNSAAGTNQPIVFRSGNNSSTVERMRISESGNVGIGTSSPAQKLEVSNPSGSVAVRINGINSANNGPYIQFAKGGTQTNVIGPYSAVLNGTSNTLTYYSLAGAGHAWVVNGGASEAMTLDASGNLLVGVSSGSSNTIQHPTQTQGNTNLFITNTCYFFVSSGGMGNAAATAMRMNANTTTSRSINASGTINANGADYAEYMTKAGDFTIAKGEICGVNSEGKLTKTFSEAVAFMVKSTNPSYVGNDNWGSDFEPNSEELEAARQLVDRIAFCGQIPVNVLGATPGQWIIPVEDNGGIKGEAVSSPSFEQYQKAVGKVIAVEEDGRARIIVKIA